MYILVLQVHIYIFKLKILICTVSLTLHTVKQYEYGTISIQTKVTTLKIYKFKICTVKQYESGTISIKTKVTTLKIYKFKIWFNNSIRVY